MTDRELLLKINKTVETHSEILLELVKDMTEVKKDIKDIKNCPTIKKELKEI